MGDDPVSHESARAVDQAKVTRSEEADAVAALEEALPATGALAAVMLSRIAFRRAVDGETPEPTLEQLDGAIEASLLSRFPDFTPTVRSERVDK